MSEPLMAAIVLAAGLSKRFGAENKLLADVGGRSVIESVLAKVAECGFDRVLVVIAPDQLAIETLVQTSGFTTAVNWTPELGMGTSIAWGMKELSRKATTSFAGVAVFLGDMPSVSSDVVGELLVRFKHSNCQNIVRPINILNEEKVPGHPVVFPTDLFEELEGLTGDAGAKELIAANHNRLTEVTVIDPGATADIDYPADLSDHGSP